MSEIDLAALAKPMSGHHHQTPPPPPVAPPSAPAGPVGLSWEERHRRTTFHADVALRDALYRYADGRGESYSAIINRAIAELLDRETGH